MTQLSAISPEKANFRYAPGKWSVKEVVGHVIDIERVMAYRAFSFSREEEYPLPGIDQEHYTPRGNYDYRELGDLVEEFKFLRLSNLRLFAAHFLFPEHFLMGVTVFTAFWLLARLDLRLEDL